MFRLPTIRALDSRSEDSASHGNNVDSSLNHAGLHAFHGIRHLAWAYPEAPRHERRVRRTLGCVAVSLGFIMASPSAAGQVCLLEKVSELGTQPGVAPIAVGDFNGDGLDDWAVATRDHTISVHLSVDGEEPILREPILEIESSASSMVAIDFTHDHVDDLIVRIQAGVVLYENDGTGMFTFVSELRLSNIIFVAPGDFNSDGAIDLAVIRTGSQILIYLGGDSGAITISPVQLITAIQGPSSLAVADFDQDNALDFAVTATVNDDVTIYFGSGDGTFAIDRFDPYFVPLNPANIIAHDLNEDAATDLVVLSTQADALSVLIGSGSGVFNRIQIPIVTLPGNVGGPLAVGDFTGDGFPDVAVTHFSPSRLSLLAGDGLGDLAIVADYTEDFSSPWFIAAGDFDNSGVQDLVINNTGRSNVDVLLALGGDDDADGVCELDDICPGGDDTHDSDGDGTPDLCDGCPNDPGKVSAGICGCGRSDLDSDGDQSADCVDRCPNGDDRMDTDGDGAPDACDGCPGDAGKVTAGACGCGFADSDDDNDGVADCNDSCPGGDDRVDSDDDGTADFCDGCPGTISKVEPGLCGCGQPDDDDDGDGVADCLDVCLSGDDNSDTDSDGMPDACDGCPLDASKVAPGDCGCGNADTDEDNDGIPACVDRCSGGDDALDGDGDTVPDECDNCPSLANIEQVDLDGDGWGDACDNCPDTSNGAQSDRDNDGMGDACELNANDQASQALPDVEDSAGNVDNSISPALVPCGAGFGMVVPLLMACLCSRRLHRTRI